MRRARLFVTGIGALVLAGCPSATAPHQVGIGGGGGGNVVLRFVTEPPDTARVGVAFLVQVAAFDTVLQVVDTTATGGVNIALGSNPTATNLQGTLTQPLVSGVSTFPDLVVNDAASGYALTATSTGRASATSRSFVVTP